MFEVYTNSEILEYLNKFIKTYFYHPWFFFAFDKIKEEDADSFRKTRFILFYHEDFFRKLHPVMVDCLEYIPISFTHQEIEMEEIRRYENLYDMIKYRIEMLIKDHCSELLKSVNKELIAYERIEQEIGK